MAKSFCNTVALTAALALSSGLALAQPTPQLIGKNKYSDGTEYKADAICLQVAPQGFAPIAIVASGDDIARFKKIAFSEVPCPDPLPSITRINEVCSGKLETKSAGYNAEFRKIYGVTMAEICASYRQAARAS